MKNLMIISTIILSLLTINACGNRTASTQQSDATQHNVDEHHSKGNIHADFIVAGNCGMCKTRIENAAKEAGAESAHWDAEHQLLHIDFKESKTSLEKIQKHIAAVGHDNENFRADDDDYENLHSCCKYERLK